MSRETASSRRLFLITTLCALALAVGSTPPATASGDASPSLASALQTARALLADLAAGRVARPSPAVDAAERASNVARSTFVQEAESGAPAILGTWFIQVPDAPDAPGFDAYQTFEAGGTFVETSSLLGSLVEGPAHGGWVQVGRNRYLLTFELFSFDENGAAAGRVRVRNRLTHKPLTDTFDAVSTIDIYTPDGELIPAVATGGFSASRVQIVAP